MADIRMQREETPGPRSDLHSQENLGTAPESRLPAGHALPGEEMRRLDTTPAADTGAVANDPDAVRAEIEHTRERMSGTIDEIENVLARKRERLQDRLDVLAPVRERPLPAAGIAFGAGLVLGLLTGGGDDSDRHERAGLEEFDGRAYGLREDMDRVYAGHAGRNWEESAHLWEDRARRLLRVAREQEAQIRELQERYGNLYARDVELRGWESDDEAAGELMSSFSNVRDTVLHGITGFLTDAFHQMGRDGGERETRGW